MSYYVVQRGFQYAVVNSQGVTCAGPYSDRYSAQAACDRLNRGRGY
jgi:hypothetical protein